MAAPRRGWALYERPALLLRRGHVPGAGDRGTVYLATRWTAVDLYATGGADRAYRSGGAAAEARFTTLGSSRKQPKTGPAIDHADRVGVWLVFRCGASLRRLDLYLCAGNGPDQRNQCRLPDLCVLG